MRTPRHTATRWLVIAFITFCIACIGAGVYLHALARPIPPLVEATTEPHAAYWPVFHKFSPAQKAHVLDGEFLIVKNVDDLPADLKSVFCRLTGMHDFEMANPGKKYQVTDVSVEEGLPFDRLLFAGISSDKYFIHYEQGGIGHSYHLAVFSIDNERTVKFLWGGPGQPAKDLKQLRKMVAAGVYKDDQAYCW